MKNGRLQAKDIADLAFLREVARHMTPIGAAVWSLDFPNIRQELLVGRDGYMKLVRSKLVQMNKKGLVHGCACGCRGDIELTESWKAALL